MFLMCLVRSIRPVPLKFLYFNSPVIFCEDYYYLSEYCVSCDKVLLLLSHDSFSGSTEILGRGIQKRKAMVQRANKSVEQHAPIILYVNKKSVLRQTRRYSPF